MVSIGLIFGRDSAICSAIKIDAVCLADMQIKIKERIALYKLTGDDISDAVLCLRNHMSIAGQRNFFLELYFVFVTAVLVLPKNWNLPWEFTGLVALCGSLALCERWNLKKHNALCDEIIAILDKLSENLPVQDVSAGVV